NEALNAGTPFTNNGKGGLIRNRQRRNDFGFTVGGPVMLPKLYNGHDKLFFFFNFEQFRETVINSNTPVTVPIAAYRAGKLHAGADRPERLSNGNTQSRSFGPPDSREHD